MSAILRHRHPNRFTVLPNDAIRNPALSFRAVGVLAHLLSLPNGAKVDSATLASAHKEGRDAVRSAFGELARHGYYRRDVVRLPDGTLRTEVVVSSTPMTGEGAGPTDAGKSGVGPGPENPAPVRPAPDPPASADPTPVDQAPTEEVPRTEELFPPQPPRPAGGQAVVGGRPGPRRTPPEPEVAAGTPQPGPPPGATAEAPNRSAGETPASGEQAPGSGTEPSLASPARREIASAPDVGRQSGRRSRAAGTNPRAEAEREEAARLEAEAAARQAELERTTEARRAADVAARAEADRLEAEALAVSAALDDAALAAVAALVTRRMAGPLARSPLAISRAVVTWCRAAVACHPASLPEAAAAGLASELVVAEGNPPAPLDLPAAPAGTALLRRRIAALVRSATGGDR